MMQNANTIAIYYIEQTLGTMVKELIAIGGLQREAI